MTTRIVFTGGGTPGHVTPNIALIDALQSEGWQIDYIGTAAGVEKNMISALNIPYHAIRCGKLRRYFSWQNFIDPINMVIGIMQASILLHKLRTDVVFSKGGFVALPVVIGAWLNRIPVIAHESDMSPGLANRLSMPFVSTLCVTFAAAKKHIKRQDKVTVTGTPIRKHLFEGSLEKGLALCGFHSEKPCLLVVGGGQGSIPINRCVRQALDQLCQSFQVIHLCGPGKVDASLTNRADYRQFDYVNEGMPDLFAASAMVISRAGANTLYEILALSKPHVLIPLSRKASRGDQIQNAHYFEQQGISVVLDEETLTPETLLAALDDLARRREEIISKIHGLHITSATTKVIEIIKAAVSTGH